jgi:hypothetical protein
MEHGLRPVQRIAGGIARPPSAILLRLSVPRARGQFERIEACNAAALLFHTARLPGVDAICAPLRFSTRLLARGGKRYDGIVSEAELGLFAKLLVPLDPHLAGRTPAKVKTLAIRQQIFLFARCCRLNLKLVELSHGVPKT